MKVFHRGGEKYCKAFLDEAKLDRFVEELLRLRFSDQGRILVEGTSINEPTSYWIQGVEFEDSQRPANPKGATKSLDNEVALHWWYVVKNAGHENEIKRRGWEQTCLDDPQKWKAALRDFHRLHRRVGDRECASGK